MPIVIVGSGPVGLYTAIRLAAKGFPVQVVDKYAGNFSRPGVVAIQAGEIITRQLQSIGIDPKIPLAGSYPETYYISEIQKALHNKAESLGVQFTSANFEGIQGHSIKVEGQDTLIDCDLLIDCTGESREVVNYVNSTNSSKVFTVSPIADNPVKTNFVAFITMSKEDAEQLSAYKGTSSPVNQVTTFETLREQGWTQNDLPHWDMRNWKVSGAETERFCCYFEMPEDLARAPLTKQKEWLSTLLESKAGKKIDFDIEPGTLKFRAFNVDPKKVEEPIYQSGVYPFPIAVCGDALISAEYRKGTGISNGIICSNGLINAINLEGGKITLNRDAFDHTVTEHRSTAMCIQEHIKEVKDLYQGRRNKLGDIKIQKDKLDRYLEALSIDPENEVIKKGLLNQINELKKLADTAYLSRQYEKAHLTYEYALDACAALGKNPSAELSELAKLYNLQSRICSNLEKTYRGLNNPVKAQLYFKQGMSLCEQALALLETPQDSDMQNLKTGLIVLHKGFVERMVHYPQEQDNTPKFP